MVKIGRILCCDRCGKVVFLESDEPDFECPEGWISVQGGDICPVCGADYGRIMSNFWSKSDKKSLHM